MKISIILVNYNGFNDTAECIESLNKVEYDNFKIIVVDNNSDADEKAELKNRFKNIEVIKNKNNLGFSGGNNVGIDYAIQNGADYILLLNNDTIVQPNLIETLLNSAKIDEQVGIVSCQINYFNEPKKIWSFGGEISKVKASGFADSDEDESLARLDDRFVTFASGCCLFIKREVFEKIGLLDQRFFLYVEDTDFCARTIKAGYKIFVTNKTIVLHKVSSSTTKNSALLPVYYTTRNRLYFVKKNYPKYFVISFFYIAFVMLIKSFLSLVKGNTTFSKTVFMAISDFILGKMGKADLGGRV